MNFKERQIAAMYFAISNMGVEPRVLSVKCINATYYEVNSDIYSDTLSDDDCDEPFGLEDEYNDWYKELGDKNSYAYKEWAKMRDDVKGL